MISETRFIVGIDLVNWADISKFSTASLRIIRVKKNKIQKYFPFISSLKGVFTNDQIYFQSLYNGIQRSGLAAVLGFYNAQPETEAQ